MWGRDVKNEQRFDAFLLQVHTGVASKYMRHHGDADSFVC